MTSQPVPLAPSPDDIDQDEPPRAPLKRSHATMSAGKGLVEPCELFPAEYEELESSSEEMPNLSLYLAQFDLSPREQMRICRAYASYLGAQLPKRQK